MKHLVDCALTQLQHSHQRTEALKTLVLIDENCSISELSFLNALDHPMVMSNRYDIYLACQALNLPATFSDFDFSDLNYDFDVCLYRVSKERALVHHIFNQVAKRLPSSGILLIEGKKNEGIKTYHQNLTKNLPFTGTLIKNKERYSAVLSKTERQATEPLNDKNYPELRSVVCDSFSFHSKPGVYGWNKIDQGSQMLVSVIERDRLKNPNIETHSILDLGCGYGYLSIKLLEYKHQGMLSELKSLVATDNNAGALLAAKENLEKKTLGSLDCEVIADDCGLNLNRRFDLIVCNPPFHLGFDSSRGLTEKFLKNASRMLEKNGSAYFVVNSFIAIEQLAQSYFASQAIAEKNTQFKVLRLSNAK